MIDRKGRRELTIQALERAQAHAEARDLKGWAGLFAVAAKELRSAHRHLAALGVKDGEPESDLWTALTNASPDRRP